jgi:hypothetical protein
VNSPQERGVEAVIPSSAQRKPIIAHDQDRQRNLIERMFARLKDFRRIATRNDKLVRKLPDRSPPYRHDHLVDLIESGPPLNWRDSHSALSAHGGHLGTPPLARRQHVQAKSTIRFFSSALR